MERMEHMETKSWVFLYNERLCGGGFDRVVVKYSRSHIQLIKKECKSVFISMNFISILCLEAAADCVVVCSGLHDEVLPVVFLGVHLL